MRKINYYKSRGQLYAKVPASSYRENGKMKKRDDGIYLGRVVNKEMFFTLQNTVFLPMILL